MNIRNGNKDIEKIFNQTWKANNYNLNGVKDRIQTQKDSFNRMYNIKSKDEIRKDILHVNSVEGRIENLNKSIQGISKNKNF